MESNCDLRIENVIKSRIRRIVTPLNLTTDYIFLKFLHMIFWNVFSTTYQNAQCQSVPLEV